MKKLGEISNWALNRHLELLLILFVVLLPFGESSHIPIAIIVIMGVFTVWKKWLPISRESRLFLLAALALILPLLISLYDAYDVARTARTIIILSLYSFAGLYIIQRFKESLDENLIIYGISAVILFWSIDGLIQFLLGTSLTGNIYKGHAVTGIFEKVRIGPTLAHFSPILFEAVRRWVYNKPPRILWAALLVIPVISVILLSGSRSAWIIFFLSSSIYALWLIRKYSLRLRAIFGAFVMVFIIIGTTIYYSPELQSRVEKTLLIFDGAAESINDAGSGRLKIWEGAIDLVSDSLWIGHGTHAFSDLAYSEKYTARKFGHVHLFGLEVAVAAGIFGLIAYLILFLFILRGALYSISKKKADLYLWLGALLMLFPLNTHWHFYGYRASMMMFFFIILLFSIKESPTKIK